MTFFLRVGGSALVGWRRHLRRERAPAARRRGGDEVAGVAGRGGAQPDSGVRRPVKTRAAGLRQTTGRHRKKPTASTAWHTANATATRVKRWRGTTNASQKNSGNNTAVNLPSEMNRWAATGGKMLTAIHSPYAIPRRRVTGRIDVAAQKKAAMSPT